MAIESILIAVVTLIICSAACFYVYIRQSHFEKKLMMVESILVDVKMAMDTIMTEGIMPAPAPISGPSQPIGGGGGGMGAAIDAEQIPEENFYSSVLAAAHEEAAAPTGSAGGEEDNSVENILEEMNRVASADAAAADQMPALVADVAAPVAVAASVAPTEQRGPNIDAMTKQELVALAEQRGLRAKKTMNRTELLNLLRTNTPLQNRDSETGVDGSDIRNSLFPDAASVDGDYPVDLGQN